MSHIILNQQHNHGNSGIGRKRRSSISRPQNRNSLIDNDETTVEVDNQSFWTELKESANAEISDATTPDPGNALEEFVESARRAAVEEKQDDLKATVHGTIHPFNPTKLKWDVFVGLIVVYAVLVVPWKVWDSTSRLPTCG